MRRANLISTNATLKGQLVGRAMLTLSSRRSTCSKMFKIPFPGTCYSYMFSICFKDRAPLVANPPDLNGVLSEINFDEIPLSDNILQAQADMLLGCT